MGEPERTARALIVVRTYPTPARSGVEVSCTAAVDDSGRWLRLFPIPYRLLGQDKRFRKYQWIEVQVRKASDPRPESYKIAWDSIKILSEPVPTDGEWKARKEVISHLQRHCLCCIQRERDLHGFPTLGFFKPFKLRGLEIEKDKNETWTPRQLQYLRQYNLFERLPERELEKIPLKFSYSFSCDHDDCAGHKLMCADWEMAQTWRSWSRQYGAEWERPFRNRWESEMLRKYDTHFFVGTVKKHPKAWIIVGVFYPPYPPSEPPQHSEPNLFSGLS